MSIIAGKKSMIEADKFINKGKSPKGSSPKGGTPNKYAIITIIGVGNVGKAAAEQAILLGYENINLIDNNYEKIKNIQQSNPAIYKTYEMSDKNLKKLLLFSNIVISSIYSNGMKASKIITTDLLELMSNNTCNYRSLHNRPIIMDVAIDQGGTTEQSLPTTLENPLIQYKNTHIYCVPNIPSTEPTEASIKLSNAVYPYLRSLVLVNDDDNLTWNGDVVITDATLESELENLGIIITPRNKENYTNQTQQQTQSINNENENDIGYKINKNPKSKKDLLAFPIGTIIQYPVRATKIPNGWLVCDGALIEKTKYPQLVDILETYEETFLILPDIKSKKIMNLIFVGF